MAAGGDIRNPSSLGGTESLKLRKMQCHFDKNKNYLEVPAINTTVIKMEQRINSEV